MRVQRIIIAVGASLALSACYTSRVITTPNITAEAPHEITVVRNDGTVTTIYTPTLQDGTLVGRSSGRECLLESCRKPDVSFQLTDVKEVKVKTLDKGKTYGLLALGAAAVVGVAVASSGNGPDMGCVANCSTNPTARTAGASIPAATVLSTLSRFAHGLSAVLR